MIKIFFVVTIMLNIISSSFIPNKINFKKSLQINSNTESLNTKEIDWYIVPRIANEPPEPNQEAINILNTYSGHYVGDISKKHLYLTFDEGYENGYTASILDTLKKHNVPAAFFVVKPYIKSNSDLIKRMISEGHLVCNHSSRHPSMAKIIDENKFKSEFSEVEEIYKETTGKDMPKFFRPPMGKLSEYSSKLTNDLGYKSILWSVAYKDFDIKNQPIREKAINTLLKRVHNGAIILLHAVSKTNNEIMDQFLSTLKSQGYEFRSLEDFQS